MATNNVNFKVKNGLDAGGDIAAAGWLYSNSADANEGGQIVLAKPTTNTGLSSPVVIDIYQNRLRFFEYAGSNRGYYLDLTSGGSAASTSLTGGTTGAMNYAQTQGTKQSNISTAGTTIVSVSITTNGYPVHVMVTGDVENNSAGGWTTLQLYRGSTAIGNIVHTEGSAASENTPYTLQVIDSPAAGTYTYALKLNTSAGGTFNFGESNGPVITVLELSGPKGDTGSAGTTYTLPTSTSTVLGGVKLFSDTAQSTAANSVTSTASRTYGAQLNASSQLVVNVPWTDTLPALTLTPNTTGFSVAGGTTSKTLTINNSLTLSGTDSSTLNIGAGGTLGSAAYTSSTAYSVSPNYILNGAFDIVQRGSTNNVSGGSGGAGVGYLLDQWVFVAGATAAPATTIVSTTQTASTANMISGYDFPYYTTFATTLVAGSTVTGASYMSQRIEDVRTLAGQQVTLSFWAKVASGTNSNFVPVIEQNFGSGGSASVTNTGSALSLTTTWTRFSYTVTLGSMSGKTIGTNSYLDVRPLQLPGANFAGNITVSIAGVKLEANSAATTFVRKNNSIAAEKLECYRYYYRLSGATAQIPVGVYAYYTTTQAYGQVKFPVPMRVAPSAATSSASALTVYGSGASKATTDILPQSLVVSTEMIELRLTTAAVTAGISAFVRFPTNSTDYLEFTAEI